ncbi:MAG: hypothetical protein A3F70_03430 [Acidobacteria bacterium RIFCSPLOWO2_12_FULL_67_14]|nr:MAG: hypothetical protein A3H29_14210 [Acidobacteria bacterium RIFCSPLOWO2_02_FULL_67_21]OFW38844.1 MAG: hypothetical protein A3F70_03430 [Acidobacteria bacterium RIFCSPLOWO2_12_FULL_67_14]
MRAGFRGNIIVPGDAGYDAARAVFWKNPLTDRRPAVIARCAGEEDVARAIELAVEQQVPLAVRGGGHSFVGWGTCDDGVVIDTSAMNAVSIDPAARIARAGAGVPTRELVAAAAPYGLVPVVGQCPGVGLAGFILGGGLGWLSGSHGAACDHLVSAEVVSADGRRLVASATEHSDLFWALRGGGGNFGVATTLTCRLYPVASVTAGTISFPLADARRAIRAFADLMEGAPDELQARAVLTRDGQPAVHINVCWTGEPGQAGGILRPLRGLGAPVRDTVQPLAAFGDTFAMSGGGVPRTYTAVKGSYLERLSPEAIDLIVDRLAEAPGSGAAIGLDHYMHGAVCRVPADATAFELRTANAVHIWVSAGWDAPGDGPASTGWIDATWEALQAHAAGRVYTNFPAAEGDEAARAAYRDNYSRLASVKRTYDPTNVFQRNHNLRS